LNELNSPAFNLKICVFIGKKFISLLVPIHKLKNFKEHKNTKIVMALRSAG